jgi:acetyl-CoA synthetase
MVLDGSTYPDLRRTFRWDIPPHFNIGVACSDAQVPSDLALLDVDLAGIAREFTFGELAECSNRLANVLRGIGVGVGDRVGIVLPAQAETAIAHLAVYKLGAIAVPISILFGADALAHRFADAEVAAIVTDAVRLDTLRAASDLPDERLVVVVDDDEGGPRGDFWSLVRAASPHFAAAVTKSGDPAFIIYTSGTTGSPKGAVHAHRALIGHQPGFRLSHDFFPQPRDRFWSPADWAWIGGLMNGLMSTLYNGRPIVCARRESFDPEWVPAFLARYAVRNTFLPPTALRMMRNADVRVQHGTLRSVMSGGEALGADTYDWALEHLGVSINEIYGQTEANYVVGGCAAAWETRVGAMGRPYPGHEVRVLGADGTPADGAELGEVGILADDPVTFLGYWRDPEQTAQKVVGGWVLTGDLASVDGDGYLWFRGRVDDVISSAGYRIGPEEIESSLLTHPAVAGAGVIGAPDEIRGERVKAYIVLSTGHDASEELVARLKLHVRQRLSAHEYPREIEFIDELPLTVTGKISRKALRERHVDAPRAGAEEVR